MSFLSKNILDARYYGKFVEANLHECDRSQWVVTEIKRLEIPMTNCFWRFVAHRIRNYYLKKEMDIQDSNEFEKQLKWTYLDNATHDCVQLLIKCKNIPEISFYITYESGGGGRHETFGAYTKIFTCKEKFPKEEQTERVSGDNLEESQIEIPFLRVDEIYKKMWKKYHLRAQNCKYWAESFYTHVVNIVDENPALEELQNFMDAMPETALEKFLDTSHSTEGAMNLFLFRNAFIGAFEILNFVNKKIYRVLKLFLLFLRLKLSELHPDARLKMVVHFLRVVSTSLIRFNDFRKKVWEFHNENLIICAAELTFYDLKIYIANFYKHYKEIIELFAKSEVTEEEVKRLEKINEHYHKEPKRYLDFTDLEIFRELSSTNPDMFLEMLELGKEDEIRFNAFYAEALKLEEEEKSRGGFEANLTIKTVTKKTGVKNLVHSVF